MGHYQRDLVLSRGAANLGAAHWYGIKFSRAEVMAIWPDSLAVSLPIILSAGGAL